MNSTPPAPLPLPPARSLLWPILIFATGMLVTLFLWSQAKNQVTNELTQEFEAEVIDMTVLVERHLDSETEVMRGLKGFFSASTEVSREGFRTYFNALHSRAQQGAESDQMGFAALSYHEIVPAQQLAAHLAKMRQQGFPDYQIQPVGTREVYAPMVYIEPFEGSNRTVLGFDPLTVSTERLAIERARDTEIVTISSKLTLAQDTKQPMLGFVMYAPLYRRGAAHETLAQRRANFIGWVDAPYRIADLIKHVLPFGVQDIDFEIYDGKNLTAENIFYQSNQDVSRDFLLANSEFKSVQTLSFGGRTWSLAFYSEPGYGGREIREKSELVVSVGFLISLMLAFITAAGVLAQRRRDLALTHQIETEKDLELLTQQQSNHRALRDSEAAARLAMESANDSLAKLKLHKFAMDQHLIMSTTDVSGAITFVNDKFCQIGGYKRAELMGQDHRIFSSNIHSQAFWQEMYELITQGAIWQGEVCNRNKQGELYWLANTVVPFIGEAGIPEQYIAMSTDITARKMAEISLRDSEFRWKFAIEGSGYGLWDWNVLNNTLFLSDAWKAIFGLASDEETLGVDEWKRRLQPADEVRVMAALMAHLDGLTPMYSVEYQARCNDGSSKWIADRGVVVARDATDYPTRMIGTVTDITQRKSIELALLESQRIAQLGSWTLDIPSGKLAWSEEIFRLFELDPMIFVPSYEAFLDAVHPEDRESVNSVYIQSLTEINSYETTYRLRMEDGRIKWVQERCITEFDAIGTPLVSRGTVQDITERKLAELDLQNYRDHLEAMVAQQTAHLQEAQQKLELITNSVPGAVYQFLRTPQGEWKFLYISKGVEELFELTAEEVYQDQAVLTNCIVPEDQYSRQRSIERSYLDLSDWWHEHRICTRSGKIKWVRGQASIQHLLDGAVLWNGILTDITERKAIENAALAANRAKSEFLANMSHEIRTPMNGVIGMVDILQQTPLSQNQHRMLRTINESSQSLLSILNDILDYSKIEAGKLAIESIPTQLREVTEGVAQLMTSVAQAKSIDLFVFISPKLPLWVATDPTRLRQILLNLLGNAVKFTHTQGRVDLRVEPCQLASGSAGIQLRVIDTGIGMSKEVVGKLFQPFTQADESTARKFGGTGLGLSITHRLVRLMQGDISVHSQVGAGSEFEVHLPLFPALPALDLPALPDLTGLRLLVLVCDRMTAEILVEYATSAGAEVIVLSSVDELNQALNHAEYGASGVVVFGVQVSEQVQNLHLPVGVGLVRLVLRHEDVGHAQIEVLARPILYRDLLHSLALASGRILAPEKSNVTERRRLDNPLSVPTIEQAIQGNSLILLAEDNETNREVMQEQLRILGYTAETAADGEIAFACWSSGRYSLLLTDCHMPNMDGFELTAAIRQAEAGARHVPIIAVTANAMEGEAQRCLAAGMDDYLSKPLRLNELSAKLEKWLPLVNAQPPIPLLNVVPTQLPLVNIGLPVWDEAVLIHLIGDNPPMQRRLLEKFLPNSAQQVAEMMSSAAAAHFEQVADCAHKLKSAARSVGAMQLGELCQALEESGRTYQFAECGRLVEHLPTSYEQVVAAIQRKLASPTSV